MLAALKAFVTGDRFSNDDQVKVVHMRTLLNWSVCDDGPFRCVDCGRNPSGLAVWPEMSRDAFCVDCGFKQCAGATVRRPEHDCCTHDHRGGLSLQDDCRDHRGALIAAQREG